MFPFLGSIKVEQNVADSHPNTDNHFEGTDYCLGWSSCSHPLYSYWASTASCSYRSIFDNPSSNRGAILKHGCCWSKSNGFHVIVLPSNSHSCYYSDLSYRNRNTTRRNQVV